MIIGAHFIQYTTNIEADRAFFRDVLKLSNVDAGGGWLIFKFPPAEAAFHPGDSGEKTELYFMTDNLDEALDELKRSNIEFSSPKEERWGKLIWVTLPGGGKIGLYQPYHPTAIS